ncbi:hypothetical protein [Actinomadura madurae]|uniref:hypothetical protein n=1 Tax=Actinomadura madurae TaxID=1993 RepID=UPI0020D236F8|nr:hypothetical protein [Actinomadura madurae]MCP9947252.1 hypothetical protein [Actinomadura madurae]MCQ0012683.1 hypothetical protein [Actinomadura madurae]
MQEARYLVGPDGLRVQVVTLDDGDLVLAQAHHRDARAGQAWFLVTRRGQLVAYCRDIEEVAEHVDLADLHGPGEAAEDAG